MYFWWFVTFRSSTITWAATIHFWATFDSAFIQFEMRANGAQFRFVTSLDGKKGNPITIERQQSNGCKWTLFFYPFFFIHLCLYRVHFFSNTRQNHFYIEFNTNPWFSLFLEFSFSTFSVSDSWFSFASFSSVILAGMIEFWCVFDLPANKQKNQPKNEWRCVIFRIRLPKAHNLLLFRVFFSLFCSLFPRFFFHRIYNFVYFMWHVISIVLNYFSWSVVLKQLSTIAKQLQLPTTQSIARIGPTAPFWFCLFWLFEYFSRTTWSLFTFFSNFPNGQKSSTVHWSPRVVYIWFLGVDKYFCFS